MRVDTAAFLLGCWSCIARHLPTEGETVADTMSITKSVSYFPARSLVRDPTVVTAVSAVDGETCRGEYKAIGITLSAARMQIRCSANRAFKVKRPNRIDKQRNDSPNYPKVAGAECESDEGGSTCQNCQHCEVVPLPR